MIARNNVANLLHQIWKPSLLLLGASVSIGCADFEPPPDFDTETGTGDPTEEDDGEVAFDGRGKGTIQPARIKDNAGFGLSPIARDSIGVGAPEETWEGVPQAGQASLLIGDGMSGLTPPSTSPSTYVEEKHAAVCEASQRFAWDRLPNRQLGAAFTFFSRHLGGSFAEYHNTPILAAPTAGAQSGRAVVWQGCYSCALFPKPDGLENLQGGRFGSSMAVGVSGQSTERLFIGSPGLGDGQVAVTSEQAYRRWDPSLVPQAADANLEGMLGGVRECQCALEGPGNIDCNPWEGVLAGSFADEEFGASLATGDLDCDGAEDLAVGAPGAALPMDGPSTIPGAGAVYVYRASDGVFGSVAPTVLRQGAFEVGGNPEEEERFGHALVFGNFNGARRLSNDRSCYDLVVSAPGEDEGAGEIQLFEGSPNGLVFGGLVIQLADLFDLSSDPGDHFGYSLSAGDLNRDGFDDLIVGAPGDGLGGSVSVIPGSPAGLVLEAATVLRQGGGLAGADEPGDQYGFALSWTNLFGGGKVPARVVVVGVPGENDGRGEIRLYRTTDSSLGFNPLVFTDLVALSQDDILGDSAPGDRFGSVLMPVRSFPQRQFQ